MPSDDSKVQVERPGIISRILFTFVRPVIQTARSTGSLNVDDVPKHDNLATDELYSKFKSSWSTQPEANYKTIIKSVLHGRRMTLFVTGLGYITAQGLSLAGPLLLGRIVSGLSCREIPDAPGCESKQTLFLCAPSV